MPCRTDDGELKVVARRKRFRAAAIRNPLLRGPARLAEAFALLPQVKRALPDARLPMEGPGVLASMLGSAIVLRAVKRAGVRPVARELVTSALSLAPAAFALRGGELAEYHGAEHVSIGTYEHGASRPKEHERCGSHLIGPMLLTTAVGNLAAERVPVRYRTPRGRPAWLGAVVASVEIFGWMTRHPRHPVARAPRQAGPRASASASGRASRPRLSSRSPSAALRACLELEHDHDA